jgi:hypothetical protein
MDGISVLARTNVVPLYVIDVRHTLEDAFGKR